MEREKERHKKAWEALVALMPIYWDMVDEYESASALIESQVKTAYQYADAFLENKDKIWNHCGR